MTAPLSRNRDYRLLWVGQALSEAGSSASTIALPLLVLALTGSAAASGLVLGAGAAAQLLAGLPAGALVDRWDRRRVMLICEAVQALAVSGLVAALWFDRAGVLLVVLVIVVLGVCRSLSEPAEDAALPALVPESQLSTAVALNAARGYLGQLAGTALGGLLFGLRRWLPFAVEALAHVATFVALLFIRIPTRTRERAPARHFRREVAEGLKWVWAQPVVRVVAVCAIGLNLFFQAFYLLVIAVAQQRGVPAGQIGVMAAMLGAGGILGALVAPRLHRALRPHTSIVGVFWVITALMPLAAIAEGGYQTGALFAAMAFLAPTANTTITTYQLLLTPDELRGRLSSVMGVTLGTAAIAGPAVGGFLVELLPATHAVLACAAGTALLTVYATANPTLRRLSRHEPAAPAAAGAGE
ncbi:MFS transporter [Saccharothrix sp. ALI-22-I]|uniref:MFS transporter n=1 Tax=Saccharothrix sp. ALI-22-I TaxID=1933778 RepID=UPI00097C97DC|nr:MFS transporter [Saccharothrix sp. ALI-22-I]ONI80242.1 MFS transporter [Saccharothrix sp. ALI-22-I]